jgi:replicative DNA helicase
MSDTLASYGNEYQCKAIASIISDRSFLERISDILDYKSFQSEAHQWIVQTTIKYFLDYKELPTLSVFKIKIEDLASDDLKSMIVTQLKLIYQKMSDTDLKFIKEQFLDFCKNQKIKSAILSAADCLESNQYDKIKVLMDSALKAGMERNVGHDYMTDIEHRMSVSCRDTVKTGWLPIDTLLDGGLGKCELGIIAAPSGVGKCVGPNTEIEIKYMETGIPVKGNSGEEHIMWISPLKKYDMGNLGELYGWQIDNILFEQEKIKPLIAELVNTHKK